MSARWWFVFALVTLVAAILSGICFGAYSISMGELLTLFLGNQNTTDHHLASSVLIDIRLPRVVLALIVGAALAVSGAVLQALFRNPLVESSIIGASSGATLSAALFLLFAETLTRSIPFASTLALPIAAFLGALVSTLLVLRIAKTTVGISIPLLLLAGIAINALVGAATGLLLFLADDDELRDITFWNLGSLGGASWPIVFILFPIVLFSIFLILRKTQHLNAFQLGEQAAFYAGVPVKQTKNRLLLIVTLLVGSTVAFVGIIGFVGLVVPHISRQLIGNDNRKIIPFSILLGASLLILADVISRTIIAPAELPIGIVTSLLGGPFFLYLLLSNKKSMHL